MLTYWLREWLCCYSSRNGWRIFTRTRLYPYISEQLNYWALQADNHDGLHVLVTSCLVIQRW